MPAQNIAAPQDTVAVKWQIVLLSCNIEDDRSNVDGRQFTEIEMGYDNRAVAARKVEIPFTIKPSRLVMMILGLRYITKGNETIADKKWWPAGVVGTKYGSA